MCHRGLCSSIYSRHIADADVSPTSCVKKRGERGDVAHLAIIHHLWSMDVGVVEQLPAVVVVVGTKWRLADDGGREGRCLFVQDVYVSFW